MRVLRSREMLPFIVVVSISALMAVAATLYMVLAPVPKGSQIATKFNRDSSAVMRDTSDKEKQIEDAKTMLQRYLVDAPVQEIGPAALKQLTAIIESKGLKLNGFRPQKVDDDGKIETVPYVVQVEGPFPQVLAFARAIEAGDSRLAVTQLQVTSSDGATDKVTSTIGVAAFRRSDTGGNKNG